MAPDLETPLPDLAYMVDCPYDFCGAKAGEPCIKTIGRSGRRMARVEPHAPRQRLAEAHLSEAIENG